MKRLFVRLFFRFRVDKERSGKFVVSFKPPFGKWSALAGERFILRSMAVERIKEIRRDAAYLLKP